MEWNSVKRALQLYGLILLVIGIFLGIVGHMMLGWLFSYLSIG